MSANLISSVQSNRHMGIESRFTAEQIEAFRRFEDEEIDRFLRKYFPFKETKIWLPEMTKEQFPLVRSETKAGIKAGIDDFLKNEGMEGLSLYVANLRKFYFDLSVDDKIREKLNQFRFKLKDVNEYSDYVCNSYSTLFIQNYSIYTFRAKFKMD